MALSSKQLQALHLSDNGLGLSGEAEDGRWRDQILEIFGIHIQPSKPAGRSGPSPHDKNIDAEIAKELKEYVMKLTSPKEQIGQELDQSQAVKKYLSHIISVNQKVGIDKGKKYLTADS